MSNYFIWDEKTISGSDPVEASIFYDKGYLFSRKFKGSMYQSRLIRIDLRGFTFTSENRRVLRKVEGLTLKYLPLPIAKESYDWNIHRIGKDFYTKKFGEKTFSASTIKSLVTDPNRSNFNSLLEYSFNDERFGYAICYQNPSLMHYAYPFYKFEKVSNNMGMGMILKAIEYAIDNHKQYFYIGTLSRPADIYKLQFNNSEWFDGKIWRKDFDEVKQDLSKS